MFLVQENCIGRNPRLTTPNPRPTHLFNRKYTGFPFRKGSCHTFPLAITTISPTDITMQWKLMPPHTHHWLLLSVTLPSPTCFLWRWLPWRPLREPSTVTTLHVEELKGCEITDVAVCLCWTPESTVTLQLADSQCFHYIVKCGSVLIDG